MSDVSRPRVIWEMVTARMSAAPLKTLVTQSGMPSIERPVMPVARKYTATIVPQGLKRPGWIVVAPRNAAAKAGSR